MEYLKQTGLIQQRLIQYATKTNSATSNFQDMTAANFTNLQHSVHLSWAGLGLEWYDSS